MQDPNESMPIFDTEGDERGYVGSPEEEIPGHTPGSAEGEDDDYSYGDHPYPSPDKTPGSAEG